MATAIGTGVSLRGIYDTKYNHVFNISGTLTQADVSKAVSQDRTAANTMKLCAAGEKIKGSLFSYENRVNEGIKIGTVSRKGYFPFTYNGTTPGFGDGVVGGAVAGTIAGSGAEAAEGAPAIVDVDTVNKIALVSIGL